MLALYDDPVMTNSARFAPIDTRTELPIGVPRQRQSIGADCVGEGGPDHGEGP